ncbi:MAG: nucleotidyltransferase family protein, partial [Anaerovibrio sp.]|nr:nucleotidyltransferase family protein [Anaerovibrio sp.]
MAVGIIAEYNPFHNGHRYMLTQIKKTYREGIIICMSGST